MDEKAIQKYAKMMEELGLTGLEVREGDKSLRLERTSAPVQSVQMPLPVQAAGGSPAAPAKPAEPDVLEVCSPMVGVFYSAPAENAAPYVQVGDHVRQGDVLCIIEAMKLMNEITAEQDGVIVEVCVGNKQVVDFGHVLFRIRKERP